MLCLKSRKQLIRITIRRDGHKLCRKNWSYPHYLKRDQIWRFKAYVAGLQTKIFCSDSYILV